MNNQLIPVILSGGVGSRLWPISRKALPKPFIKLPSGHSLLQHTYQRAMGLTDVHDIITVTHVDYYLQTKNEFAGVNGAWQGDCQYLLEPLPRNTAAAILLPVLMLEQQGRQDDILLIMPADHLIVNTDYFNQTIQRGMEVAAHDKVVTFGANPTAPATGYGYIKMGKELATLEAFCVEQFVEKPTLDVALSLFTDGEHLWNTGIFCAKVSVLSELYQQLMPELFQRAQEALQQQKQSSDALRFTKETFNTLQDISFDYAILEKAHNVAVVKAQFDWNDVGTWQSFGDLLPQDEQGNQVKGDTCLLETNNCLIHAEDRLVATLGVDDLLIVDTPDALLVASREKSQDIKKLVSRLKEKNHETYNNFRTVCRPWGSYTVLEQGDFFKIKRIVVKPDGILSLQKHYHRNEHWVVVSGTATIIVNDEKKLLFSNESTYIPAGSKHRLLNEGIIDLVIIEVQTGEYLGEDDIVRYSDSYGRVEQS